MAPVCANQAGSVVADPVEPSDMAICNRAVTCIGPALCRDQRARVAAEAAVSRQFAIGRGTKQGDPMSPKLFNAALQSVFARLAAKWADEGAGIKITELRWLTNLRFADDVLLTAGSAEVLEAMLADLAREAGAVGLQLHYGKTKVICNRFAREGGCRENFKVEGHEVAVLPEGATVKYLGRALRLDNHNEAEVEHRLAMAWRRFMGLRVELCNRKFPLLTRLKLFGATVSQTLLYGAGTWTLKAEIVGKLTAAQRKMLRMMVARKGEGKGREGRQQEERKRRP